MWLISRGGSRARDQGAGNIGCLVVLALVAACVVLAFDSGMLDTAGSRFLSSLSGTAGTTSTARPTHPHQGGRSDKNPRPDKPTKPHGGRPAPTPSKAIPTSPKSEHYDVLLHPSCSSATGTPTTCTLFIRNAPDSTAVLSWTAFSTPPGARFTPASGTLARGATTDPITVVIPLSRICPVELGIHAAGGFSAKADVRSVDGKTC